MLIKVYCILPLIVMAMILLGCPQTAISLKCYDCVGVKKEPYQDTSCNKTQNCTGAENYCSISIQRYKSETVHYNLQCLDEVHCKSFTDGCIKYNDTSSCSKCCTTDLCNDPSTFKGINATALPTRSATAPPTTTTSSAGWIQVLPLNYFLATLTVIWFGS